MFAVQKLKTTLHIGVRGQQHVAFDGITAGTWQDMLMRYKIVHPSICGTWGAADAKTVEAAVFEHGWAGYHVFLNLQSLWDNFNLDVDNM